MRREKEENKRRRGRRKGGGGGRGEEEEEWPLPCAVFSRVTLLEQGGLNHLTPVVPPSLAHSGVLQK